MTSTTFRSATEHDVDTVVALVESAYRGEASRAGWTTEADLLDGRRTDADEVRAHLAHLVLAVEADELVACCLLEPRDGHGYFGMFAVRPDRQGGGLGSRLLAEAERRAHALGLDRVEMTVLSARRELLAFYERRGYLQLGRTEPFPYGDERFGIPRRDDLSFVVLGKDLRTAVSSALRLADGRDVTVRPIRGDDTERLRDMHRRLSTTSVRRRFFALMRDLPLTQAEHFTHVDGTDRAALVAVDDDGSILGVARYDRAPGTAEAEFAIVVEDQLQHQGLGTGLLQQLAQYAREHGITRFTAEVLDDNRPLFRTLADSGLTIASRSISQGVDHLVIELQACS